MATVVLPMPLTSACPTASVDLGLASAGLMSMRLPRTASVSIGAASWRMEAFDSRPLRMSHNGGLITDGTHTLHPADRTNRLTMAHGESANIQSVRAGRARPGFDPNGTKSCSVFGRVRYGGQADSNDPTSSAAVPARRVRFSANIQNDDEDDDDLVDAAGLGCASASWTRGAEAGSATWTVGQRFVRQSLPPVSISVVAPGGGTGFNAPVYAALGQRQNMSVKIVGQSRAAYDRYPLGWQDGAPAPNLESFADDLLAESIVEKSSCLVVGSRGGQVVLPRLWQKRGSDVPPAVVINGGIAMRLPTDVQWPESAVTFLLLGGNDYFKMNFSPLQYLADARSRVPPNNCTTAILLVNEMSHMPDTRMLMAIMHLMVSVVVSWKCAERRVRADLDEIMQSLVKLGLSGRLHYTRAPQEWAEFGFSSKGVVVA